MRLFPTSYSTLFEPIKRCWLQTQVALSISTMVTLSTVYSSPFIDNKLKVNFAEALLTKHPPPAKHHPFTLRSLQATQWFQSCPCRGTIFHGYRIVPVGPPLWCDLIDGRIQAQVWKFLEEMINPSKSSHSSWKVRRITLETLGAATP